MTALIKKNKTKPIVPGAHLPNVTVRTLQERGLKDMETDSLLAKGKIVLFGLPGAFTPVCSAQHLPGYIRLRKTFQEAGYETVCLSVNDPFVMTAWMRANGAQDFPYIADGNADFTRALGLDADYTSYGYGTRARRFALIAENGIVKKIRIERAGEFLVSSAEAMLEEIGIGLPEGEEGSSANPCGKN